MKRAEFINTALRLGMRIDEMYALTPGEFSDVITVWNERNKN